MGEDYIERGALCHKAQAFASNVIFGGCDEMLTGKDSCNPAEWTRGYKKGVADTVGLFMGQPAADVVEVKHGRWVHRVETVDSHEEDYYVCSLCGYEFWDTVNYCPNCGARMDGGADNG